MAAVSVIIPVYNSERTLKPLYEGITKALRGCRYEIIFVNDCSADGSLNVLREIKRIDRRVRLVSLRSNRGQQEACLTGLLYATGEIIANLDDDLAHNPFYLNKMISILERDALDIVYARPRRCRISPDGLMRDLLFDMVFDKSPAALVSSFRVYTRDVAERVLINRRGFNYFSALVFSAPVRAKTLFYSCTELQNPPTRYASGQKLKLFAKIFTHYAFTKGRKKTLLILGGSNCQMNAFKLAKRLNLNTALYDYTDSPPASVYADRRYKISTFDVSGCVDHALRLKPDAVFTTGTDQPVYTAARIAERLSLPSFLDSQTALAVTDKAVMKRVFAENGIPSAKFHIVDKAGLEKLDIDTPVVIKPLDSQGQRGVFYAENTNQAAEWFDECLSFSRQDKILCEMYYPSDEITVSAWVTNGSAAILTVTDRVIARHGRSIGVCLAHRYPSVSAEGHETQIKRMTDRITAVFGIQTGPLYIQMLIGTEGVIVNEVACRIGGAFEDVFIPRVTGFDILSRAVAGAFGVIYRTPPEIDRREKYVYVLMIFAREGEIEYITPVSEILALSFVCDAAFNYKVCDTVPALENGTARIGHAVLVADSKAELDAFAVRYYKVLKILDKDGKDMVIYKDAYKANN